MSQRSSGTKYYGQTRPK
uniref:Uncharacterized protein n=1 Tax=Anguilla anguilla TaxID=7936 RepID=A0A0E9U388_ANGAN